MDKLRAAAVQALEAIGDCSPNKALVNAAYALREALAKPCVNGCDTSNGRCVDCPDSVSEQAEQEPVAWAYIDADGSFMDALDRKHGAYQTPLYAAPVRTKDLTDDEIHKALYGKDTLPGLMNGIRAVIAADREKNK